jgi:LRR receptor-like serine/threonine-protein kinase FLS2
LDYAFFKLKKSQNSYSCIPFFSLVVVSFRDRLQIALLDSKSILAEEGNRFSNSIPTELCTLTDLIVLGLSQNQLTGTIPECLGTSLTNLRVLNVRSNQLQGTIPTSSLKSLTLLERLDLSDNQFSGTLFPANDNNDSGSWMEPLIKLQTLAFYKNQFVGTLPESLWSSSSLSLTVLTNLEFISGSWNNFTGPLPTFDATSATTAVSLQAIDFSYNQITGTISTWLATLPSLGKM